MGTIQARIVKETLVIHSMTQDKMGLSCHVITEWWQSELKCVCGSVCVMHIMLSPDHSFICRLPNHSDTTSGGFQGDYSRWDKRARSLVCCVSLHAGIVCVCRFKTMFKMGYTSSFLLKFVKRKLIYETVKLMRQVYSCNDTFLMHCVAGIRHLVNCK